MSTNLGVAVVVALLMWLIGPAPFLLIHGPIFVLAATIGVWLFYVQHQFENTRWAHEAQWSLPEAALHGSSYYDLPIVLRWFSANIGVHHVHHLSSRIPFYRLREVLRDYPELGTISRVTLWQSLRCVNYTLWDEDAQRLISFGALRKKLRGTGAGRERRSPKTLRRPSLSGHHVFDRRHDAGKPATSVSGDSLRGSDSPAMTVVSPRLPPHPLDLPLQLDPARRLHPPAHFFAERLDVGGGGAAAVDEEIAVHRRNLRVADDAGRGSRRRRSIARPCGPAGS